MADVNNPTLFNPNHVTALDGLRISDLTQLILTKGNNDSRDGFGCEVASMILPLSNLTILQIEPQGADSEHANLTVNIDPASLDVGLLHLQHLAGGLFPYPVNQSSIGDVATWWRNATINDRRETQDFLAAVVNMCSGVYCRSGYITIGNPDIVGIGMLTSVATLLFLALAFSLISIYPLAKRFSCPSFKPRFSFRDACIGTVDELFSAVSVFTLAVLVSTLVFRYRSDTRFDALMANAMSLFCSTALVMLAATYWAHNKERPHATGTMALAAVLTVVMFATNANVVSLKASPAELACGTGRGRVSTIRGDPFDMQKFHFVPVGFGAWCLAFLGALFHHPWAKRHKPCDKRKVALGLWRFAESLSSVFGFVGLAIYAAYFFHTWHMMRETYGDAFSKNVQTWGFGQYLAVFTWLPPILAFVHLYFAGMKDMLETKLPHGWKVVYREHECVSSSQVELKPQMPPGDKSVVQQTDLLLPEPTPMSQPGG